MDRTKTILLQTDIAAAAANQLSDVSWLPRDVRTLYMQATFVYGAGGTTVKAWVQTTVDNGATWCDIACFAFTTAGGKKITAVRQWIALAAATVPTDATLADDDLLDGLIGDRVRVKWTSTGTYTGTTNLKVTAIVGQ